MQEVDDSVKFACTPYRISTNTATGTIGAFVDLNVLFDNAPLIPLDAVDTGIVYMEYGRNKVDILSKGMSPNKRKVRVMAQAVQKQKRFSNQATTVLKIYPERAVYVNMKVFNNGKVQMTGVKDISDGMIAIECLIAIIRRIHAEVAVRLALEEVQLTPAVTGEGEGESADKRVEVSKNVVEDPSVLAASNYTIHLINSDFRVNFEIKRELLHRTLVDEYHNKCTYEPCIYPGVKIQYYYNTELADGLTPNGNCQCPGSACTGRKRSLVCKKITIAVFQSGCVIITGANCIPQIEACYAFINDVLRKHMHTIKKKKFVSVGESAANYTETNSTDDGPVRKIWIRKSALIGAVGIDGGSATATTAD